MPFLGSKVSPVVQSNEWIHPRIYDARLKLTKNCYAKISNIQCKKVANETTGNTIYSTLDVVCIG